MKKSIFLLLAIAFTLVTKAQIQTQAVTPQTIANYIPGYSQVTTVNTVTFPYTPTTPSTAPTPVDGDTTTEDNGVYNYGTIIAASIPLSSGNYTTTTSGKVWTVRVSIPNALNIGLRFTLFNLAPAAEMYIYNDAKTVLNYKIKKADFTLSDTVSISPLTGNAVTVYVVEPGNFTATLQSNITIGKVVAGYLNVDNVGSTGGTTTLTSGPVTTMGASITCIAPIMCYSQFMPSARAVARVFIPRNSNYGGCSGTLINNENNDGRAYFLTAFHCVDANKDGNLQASEITALRQAIFQFQFWRTTCNGAVNNTSLDFVGATLRAASRASDVALLELLNPPGIGDGVNYAGWNRTAAPSGTSSFIIHHPESQDMRITKTSRVGTFFFNANYWNAHYSAGVVTRGSSGSALFNENTQIVGQLKGGWSSCSFTDYGDRYGKFDRSWTGANLQQWLSPTQNLVNTSNLILSSLNIDGPGSIACNGGSGQFSVPNLLGATYNWVVSANLQITSGINTSAITVSNSGGGSSGTITVTIRTPTKGRTRFLTINKSIGTGAPIVNISALQSGPCNGSYQTWSLNATSPNTVSSWQWTVDPSATGTWNIYSPSSPSTNVSVSGGGGGISVTATSSCGTTKNGVTIYSNCPLIAITASPNPTTDNVTIAVAGLKNVADGKFSNTKKAMMYEIKIIDQLGTIKKRYRYSSGTSNTNISLKGFINGIYTVQAFDGTKWSSVKVIKQ